MAVDNNCNQCGVVDGDDDDDVDDVGGASCIGLLVEGWMQ